MSGGGSYEFGEFVLDPAHRSLLGPGRNVVVINARAFDALVYLVTHAGEVVSRAALAEALWPTTVVEDNNLSQTILALRRALGDDPDAPRYVATVPRRGYQFVATVRRLGPHAEQDPPAGRPALSRRPRRMVAALALAGLVGALVAMLRSERWSTAEAPTSAPSATAAALPRSVAVLPCRSLSPRADDAYFASGMHEELLDRLARVRGINVIASTSVQRYAGRDVSIPAVATELHVRTVVECTVRYAADRVRVSVRLIDGATSGELWSESYETLLGDAFAVQDEIAQRIGSALEAVLPGTRGAAPPTGDAVAYAAYLRAISLYRTNGGVGVGVGAPLRAQLLELLSGAIAADPEFAAALAWRAHVNADALLFDSWPGRDRGERVAELVRAVEVDAGRALEIDPQQGRALVSLARLDMFRWRIAEARAGLDRALAAVPSDAVVAHYSALIDLLRGDAVAAIAGGRRALELDPKNAAPYGPLAIALRAVGDIDGAVAAYEAMIEVAPAAPIGYVGLARTLTARGDDARLLDTLRIAEQFLGELRSFKLDAALSYAHLGRRADAARLVEEFRRQAGGERVDPGLTAMAAIALGDYGGAATALRTAMTTRSAGMDPVPLEQLRQNSWSDPVLDQPEWRELRDGLAYRRVDD